jgi:hypothetical protein
MAPLLITHFVVDGWQVIGGAGSFQLPKRLLSVVESGLKDVVSHANALFISGGLHSGVFRVIGELVSSLESNTPLIGVSTLECIKSHELLRSPGDGSDVVYPRNLTADGNGAPLDRHHTHHIAIETGGSNDGEKKIWGTELTFRAQLEATMAARCGVPIVQLIVQGGPGAMRGVLEMCRQANPTVVVVESGGAALALYLHFQRVRRANAAAADDEADHAEKSLNVTPEDWKFAEKLMADTFEQLREIHALDAEADGTLVRFFLTSADLLGADGVSDLSSTMLEAAIAQKLHLADKASRLLRAATPSAGGRGSRSISAEMQAEALARAAAHAASNANAEVGYALQLTVMWDLPGLAMAVFRYLDASARHSTTGPNLQHKHSLPPSLSRSLCLG